ncbi:hypothetical protein BJ912DRAFT_287898 [Pholiota molesta]|nr:hypothetical protein BJ912DRAFT_287898 [Pholiota molesta]
MSAVISFLKKVWKIIYDFFWPPDPDAAYDEAIEHYKAYGETKDIEDLRATITLFEYALQLRQASKDKADLPSLLANYAVVLWSRYKDDPASVGDTKQGYLRDVIKLDEDARLLWKAKPPAGDQYPTLLTNLANAYFELFDLDRSHETASLTQSLALNREMFDDSSYADEYRYAAALRIGEALWIRYAPKARKPEVQFADEKVEESNEMAGAPPNPLDEAITMFEYAEKQDNTQTRMSCFYFMAKVYSARYGQSSQMDDLDNAIKYNRQASEIMSADDKRLETCLRDLCAQLLRKYDDEKEGKNKGLLMEARRIAQGKFADLMEVIENRETRKATL